MMFRTCFPEPVNLGERGEEDEKESFLHGAYGYDGVRCSVRSMSICQAIFMKTMQMKQRQISGLPNALSKRLFTIRWRIRLADKIIICILPDS